MNDIHFIGFISLYVCGFLYLAFTVILTVLMQRNIANKSAMPKVFSANPIETINWIRFIFTDARRYANGFTLIVLYIVRALFVVFMIGFPIAMYFTITTPR
jgi:hypothetical protein